jgi:hypothetical protein
LIFAPLARNCSRLFRGFFLLLLLLAHAELLSLPNPPIILPSLNSSSIVANALSSPSSEYSTRALQRRLFGAVNSGEGIGPVPTPGTGEELSVDGGGCCGFAKVTWLTGFLASVSLFPKGFIANVHLKIF